jgi:hypothetical protein
VHWIDGEESRLEKNRLKTVVINASLSTPPLVIHGAEIVALLKSLKILPPVHLVPASTCMAP